MLSLWTVLLFVCGLKYTEQEYHTGQPIHPILLFIQTCPQHKAFRKQQQRLRYDSPLETISAPQQRALCDYRLPPIAFLFRWQADLSGIPPAHTLSPSHFPSLKPSLSICPCVHNHPIPSNPLGTYQFNDFSSSYCRRLAGRHKESIPSETHSVNPGCFVWNN